MTYKTGVFLCTCGKIINKRINFKKVVKELKPLADVVEVADYLCGRDISYITQHLRWKDERRLDRIIIAGCPENRKGGIFKEVLKGKALVTVDIREGCSWVHHDKDNTTAKTIALLKLALKRGETDEWRTKIDPKVLLFGGAEAVRISELLTPLGVETEVYSDIPLSGFQNYPYELVEIKGSIGNFEVSLRRECFIDGAKCIDCGKCLEACSSEAIDKIEGLFFIQKDRCTKCEKCLRACPTEAINLEEERKSVKTGQIVIFRDSSLSREGVYNCYDPESRIRLGKGKETAFRILEYIRGRLQHNQPVYHQETCANICISGKEVPNGGCDYCMSACPYGIIRMEGGLFIDEKGCQECGFCQGACPQGAVVMTDYSNEEIMAEIDTLMENQISPIMLVTCNSGRNVLEMAGREKMKYPVVIPLYLPCIGHINETHLLRAFEAGAKGVLILCSGRECPHSTSLSITGKRVNIVRRVLEGFEINGDRLRILKLRDSPKEVVKSISKFTASVKENPGLGKVPPVEGNTPRELFLNQLKRLKKVKGLPKDIVIESGELPYGKITIDPDKCVNCGACATHCGTGALKIEKSHDFADIIAFHYPYCIACGVCRAICPENAINLRKIFQLQEFVNGEKEIFTPDLLPCSKCGKPFISKGMLEKIRKATVDQVESLTYCSSCRDEIIFENMFK